ncbi:TPA: hypothetical protein ACH3X1_008743 [Trebouxia sp. C0004]
MTQHAKQLGSSSGLAAAWCQCVHEKAQGQLQPGDGNNGIMVQKMQQLSGVSAMSDQAGTNSKPSFSQAQGSAPPSGASSPSSGLKTEAATGSLTAANGLLDDAQQQQQKAALGPHGPMPQQDSGKAWPQGLLRTASTASSTNLSSSSAGQRSPAGIRAHYMSAAKASVQKLSASMQTRAGAAAEAFADGTLADKIAQKQQAFLQRASTSDAATVADRLAAKGQHVLRHAAASDAAAAASAKATMAATKAVEGAANVSALAQQWTAKSLEWGKTISWFD